MPSLSPFFCAAALALLVLSFAADCHGRWRGSFGACAPAAAPSPALAVRVATLALLLRNAAAQFSPVAAGRCLW